jgi:hypothetical protein
MRANAVSLHALVVTSVLVSGRLVAGELQLPADAQIASCSADAVATSSGGYFANLRVTCADLRQFLSQAHVVSEWKWRHEYSHVGDGDRTGRLTLRDGTQLRWMIRPGGLAYLESAAGERVYLVRCCVKTQTKQPP